MRASLNSPARATPRPEEAARQMIGRYMLLQKIGEGGRGVVYMAEQQEPVRRRVALKVMKLGMDTMDARPIPLRRYSIPRVVAAAFACALLFTGCVSSKYKRAEHGEPPPVALNLAAAKPPLAATLHAVIVFHGPGSWKRDAYWDEYVISIANTGSIPAVLDAAALADFRHRTSLAGENPWKLEEESMSRAERSERTENNVAVQIGAGVGVAAGGLATASVGAAALVAGTGAGAAAIGAVAVGVVALPAYIVGSVVKNRMSRRSIENEFQGRRLVLPATLAAGQTVQGSLFFPVSPGPRDLSLRARHGSDRTIITIDLKPIGGLHLKTPPNVTPPPPP